MKTIYDFYHKIMEDGEEVLIVVRNRNCGEKDMNTFCKAACDEVLSYQQQIISTFDNYDPRDWGVWDTFGAQHLNTIKVDEPTLSDQDKKILSRCIDKEGFDYAMLYCSDYKSVTHNIVNDQMFHEKLKVLRDAHNDLQFYLRCNGVEVE